MKIKYLLVILAVAVGSSVVFAAAPDESFDYRVAEKLLNLMDAKTGQIKKISVRDLENLVSEIRPFRELGFGLRPGNLMILRYTFKDADVPSPYGFEILAIKGEDGKEAFRKSVVINARLTYMSPAGVAYVSPLFPVPWKE